MNPKIGKVDIDYQAPFGSLFASVMLFMTVAVFVWGGLGVGLRMMMSDTTKEGILDAEFVEEGSA